MLDLALEHIGNRLDAPVRMPGESGDIIVRVLGVKVIQEQKRVEKRDFRVAESAFKPDAGSFDGRLASEYLSYLALAAHICFYPKQALFNLPGEFQNYGGTFPVGNE